MQNNGGSSKVSGLRLTLVVTLFILFILGISFFSQQAKPASITPTGTVTPSPTPSRTPSPTATRTPHPDPATSHQHAG